MYPSAINRLTTRLSKTPVILSGADAAQSAASAQSKDPNTASIYTRCIRGFSKRTAAILVLLFAAIISTAASAQSTPIALKGGKLLTITHGTIDNGVLIMQGDKITAVGSANSVSIPANAQIIDATGMTIYPGLIHSETQLGLTEISAEPMTNDLVEMSDEIMPHMHVYDAFHAESVLIPVARLNGITNAIVAPESADTIPGQDSFIRLSRPRRH